MLESLGLSQQPDTKPHYKSVNEEHALLKMRKNERMGGSVPVWEKPSSAQEKVTQRLNFAGENSFESHIGTASFVDHYADIHENTQAKPFGFGDIVDMVNPLHHVPIVGHIYREVTGDEIRGVSKVMGGAVFGGPLGAAGGVVNVAMEDGTGKGVMGHVSSALAHNNSYTHTSAYQNMASNSVAQRLNAIEPGAYHSQEYAADENDGYGDEMSDTERIRAAQAELIEIGRGYIRDRSQFLGSAIAVADLTSTEDRVYEYVDAAQETDDRMAGTIAKEVDDIRDVLPPREMAITGVEITSLR